MFGCIGEGAGPAFEPSAVPGIHPNFPSSSVPVVSSSSRLFEVSLVAGSSLAPLSPRFLPHPTRPHVQTHPLHPRQRLLRAIEALTNANLEVDRALDKANKTLHRQLEEIPLESESEADAKIISGKWVLKPHAARYVLRSFEENVKDEDVVASTTMTASVRMLLSLKQQTS